MDESELEAAVERGAEWLNTVYPEWRTHIVLSKLELDCPYQCVLGQLFGYVYQPGFKNLHSLVGTTWITEHGFDLPADIDPYIDFDVLQDLWVRKIQEGT